MTRGVIGEVIRGVVGEDAEEGEEECGRALWVWLFPLLRLNCKGDARGEELLEDLVFGGMHYHTENKINPWPL